MSNQNISKEERKLILLKQIFESILEYPTDTLSTLTERHQKLLEQKEVIAAPSQNEAIEGLKLFLQHKLDKKFYSQPYSIESGGSEEDIDAEYCDGSYTVNGIARFVYEYKGWGYAAEDIAFSRTYYCKRAKFKGNYDAPPDLDDVALESAEWTDDILYLTLIPLDRTKESDVDVYELSREALGPVGLLLNQYFAK